LPQLKREDMSEKIDMSKALLNAEINVTGKRYCTSCQVMRPAEYGKMIKAGKITRWKCTACFERINIPRYGKKRGNDNA
jgi:hypothetical protein